MSTAPPRISLITAVYDPPLDVLEDTIVSVLAQTIDDWEWVLVDDRSPNPGIVRRLRRLAEEDPRVRLHERENNGGIVAASADALSRAGGEFIGLLDHDDVLEPHALELMLRAAADEPGADYLYSDQDRMKVDGQTHAPLRKPRWSPERFRHHMYTTHFSVLRRELVVAVGGFRDGFEGSQDHDLVLRVTERARSVVHVPEVLYHWREVPGSAAADADAKPYAWDAGVRAVQSHLDRVGVPATVSRGPTPGLYRLERTPDLTTPVSIVIPTRGSSGRVWGRPRDLVVETVRSILTHTAHRELEFVVVYDLDTPAHVMEALRDIEDIDLVLVPFAGPFNFSEKCNVGALHARHEVLLFLNDDIEAESPGVVEQLIAPLAEPGVGATGPKLLFEDLRVQHAGLVYGSGTVTHSYYGVNHPDHLGRYSELFINREVSALTGACLAVRRDVFTEVGGFSELLPVNYNDVDLSLKIRSLGLRLLWMHDTVLFHFESMTRSSTVHQWETDFLMQRWGDYREIPERYSISVTPTLPVYGGNH